MTTLTLSHAFSKPQTSSPVLTFCWWPWFLLHQENWSNKKTTSTDSLCPIYPPTSIYTHILCLSACLTISIYYGLNICVLPKFICWNLMPNVMVLGGGVLMTGISALMKETPESSLTPTTMWGHSKKVPSVNQKAGPHQMLSAGTLILHFPVSRTISHPVYGILS